MTPIYEYECHACGTRREVIHVSSYTVEPPRCDTCGEIFVKIMSPSWFRLYGQGVFKPSKKD